MPAGTFGFSDDERPPLGVTSHEADVDIQGQLYRVFIDLNESGSDTSPPSSWAASANLVRTFAARATGEKLYPSAASTTTATSPSAPTTVTSGSPIATQALASNADTTTTAGIAKLAHPSLAACKNSLFTFKVQQVDLNGDGLPDTLASTTCNMATGSSPVEIDAFLRSASGLTVEAVLLPGTDQLDPGDAFTISGNKLTLHLTGHASNDPGCCPSLHYVQTFSFSGTTVQAGPRVGS